MMKGLEERDELWASIDTVPEEFLKKPNQDGWSLLHILEHLYLAEQSALNSIKEALSNPPLTDDQFIILSIEDILSRTNKRVAPMPLRPVGAFHNLNEAKYKLDYSREQFLCFLSSETIDNLHSHGALHPRGMIRADEWVQLVEAHERRHIAQIEEMKKSFKHYK